MTICGRCGAVFTESPILALLEHWRTEHEGWTVVHTGLRYGKCCGHASGSHQYHRWKCNYCQCARWAA